MTISDSAPLQVLAEGFVTFPGGVGTAPLLISHGIESISRGSTPQGSFDLVLDRGLIGNAGAVEAVPEPPLAPPPTDPNVRTVVTLLGVIPTGVVTIGVSYILSLVPGVGARAISIVTSNIGLAQIDPVDGFAFLVLRGYGGGPVP